MDDATPTHADAAAGRPLLQTAIAALFCAAVLLLAADAYCPLAQPGETHEAASSVHAADCMHHLWYRTKTDDDGRVPTLGGGSRTEEEEGATAAHHRPGDPPPTSWSPRWCRVSGVAAAVSALLLSAVARRLSPPAAEKQE